jgi:hypothetical protein
MRVLGFEMGYRTIWAVLHPNASGATSDVDIVHLRPGTVVTPNIVGDCHGQWQRSAICRDTFWVGVLQVVINSGKLNLHIFDRNVG